MLLPQVCFTAYIEKVLGCTHNVLLKSEYIEYKTKYMTHKVYEYEYEYFKNVLKYMSTRIPSTSALGLLSTANKMEF